MTKHKLVNCPIEEPADPYGEFVNSFRISSDGSEILLDFCLYSEIGEKAKVVSRVRVSQEFLAVIHKKIGSSLKMGREETRTAMILMPQIEGD